MQTWVFQGNPARFEIDDYLATQPTRFVWLVSRYAEAMRVGDRVFIYRTGGEDRAATAANTEISLTDPTALLRPSATLVAIDRNRWSPSVGTRGRHRRNAHYDRWNHDFGPSIKAKCIAEGLKKLAPQFGDG